MAMVQNDFSREQVISHLAHRPNYIIRSVIQVDETAKLSFTKTRRVYRSSSPLPSPPPSSSSSSPSPLTFLPSFASSIGELDILPLEVLHASLLYLDLQSLSRFLRVSRQAKAVVESLPVYRDLLLSAGHVFTVLKRTGVISLHSAATLHTALRSEQCVSCLECYGPFLFLLSAERCCYTCMARNQSLWMIPLTIARECFHLRPRDLKKLPTLWSIPGTYSVEHSVSRKRAIRLTSVRAAKDLALRIHGSTAALALYLAKNAHGLGAADANSNLDKTSNKRLYYLRWLRAAPMEPLPAGYENPGLTVGNVPNDRFCGMGCVAFPSLSKREVENGIWCRGCELTNNPFSPQSRFNNRLASDSAPQGRKAHQYLRDLQYRARSQTDFLEHAKCCYSAREVIESKYRGLL